MKCQVTTAHDLQHARALSADEPRSTLADIAGGPLSFETIGTIAAMASGLRP